MYIPNPELGDLIRKHRLLKGLSQTDLARKLTKCTGMFISLLELNKSKIPPNLLGQMIHHLELPEKEIVGRIVERFRQSIEDEIAKGKKAAKARGPARS